MGVFDSIDDFGKVIGDLVGGRGEPQGPTAQTPPSTPGTLGRLGKAIKGAAGSEILDAGQVLIAGMRLTTGWGDPEQGEPFGQGSARFSSAGETVGSAYPGEDWQGDGADAYSVANRRQAGHTAAMAVLDRSVQTVIAREAYQVAYHRDKLDDVSNYLGDLSYVTWSIGLIPGVGKELKAAYELAVVNAAVGVCGFELYHLSQEVGENATELRELAGEYATLTEKAALPDLAGELPQPPQPPQPPSDDRPIPGPADQQAPGQPAPTGRPGSAPTPSPGASAPGSSAAATPSPTPAPATEVRAEETAATAELDAAPAMPADAMAGMTAAFGAVGGIIGSVVAPLAAVLTGVAGAAGQSLSTLASAGGADTGAGETPTGEDVERTRDLEADDEPEDDDAVTGAPGAAGGAVPAEVVTESDAPPTPPADRSAPAPEPAPPAATRPPQ